MSRHIAFYCQYKVRLINSGGPFTIEVSYVFSHSKDTATTTTYPTFVLEISNQISNY